MVTYCPSQYNQDGKAYVRRISKIAEFLRAELGQSLTEHTLLIAFVAMLALSVFIAAGGNTQNIWSMGNSQLAAANQSVTPSAASSTPTDGNTGDDHHHHH